MKMARLSNIDRLDLRDFNSISTQVQNTVWFQILRPVENLVFRIKNQIQSQVEEEND